MSYTIGEVVFETSLFLTVTKDMHKIDKTSRFIGQKYRKSDQPQDKINPMMCEMTGENKGIITFNIDCLSMIIIVEQIIIPIRKNKPVLQITALNKGSRAI